MIEGSSHCPPLISPSPQPCPISPRHQRHQRPVKHNYYDPHTVTLQFIVIYFTHYSMKSSRRNMRSPKDFSEPRSAKKVRFRMSKDQSPILLSKLGLVASDVPRKSEGPTEGESESPSSFSICFARPRLNHQLTVEPLPPLMKSIKMVRSCQKLSNSPRNERNDTAFDDNAASIFSSRGSELGQRDTEVIVKNGRPTGCDCCSIY